MLKAEISGKIIGVQQVDGNQIKFLSKIRTPAPDKYTSPATFQVLSTRKIDDMGKEVCIPVQIAGYEKRVNGRSFFNTTIYLYENGNLGD
jgi:hypothetical protein